jgi:hypothetical protein
MRPAQRLILLFLPILVHVISDPGQRLWAQEPMARIAIPAIARPVPAPLAVLPAISTERPTAGYSPDLVPRRTVQAEYGINWSIQRGNVSTDAPESLVRVGLCDRAEVRFLTDNLVYQRSSAQSALHLQSQDAAISTKLLLSSANSVLPKSAIVSLTLPVGSKHMTSGSYDPSLVAIWTQALSHGYSVNEVAQVTLTTKDGARVLAWSPSIEAGRSLSGRLSIFAEFAPSIDAYQSFAYVADGGFAYSLSGSRQLDVRTGYARDAAGLHGILSLGYSIRYDRIPGVSLTR